MGSAFSFFPSFPTLIASGQFPDTLFFVGFVFFMAGVLGEWCWKVWRLPRITGYGTVGLIVGPAGLGIIDRNLVTEATLLMNIALSLLVFELGSRLSMRWIRTNPWLVVTSLTESILTFSAVFLVLHAMHFEVSTAMIAASIAVATSPTMMVQLKSELKSEGQVTERLLMLAALNSMYAIVFAKLSSVKLHQAYYGNVLATITEPLYLIVGSIALAYALAWSCRYIYYRFNVRDEHAFVILIGLILLTLSLVTALKLSITFTMLVAGIVYKNMDERPQLWATHFGTAGWLLAVILFLAAPLSFEWRFVALGGLGALALIVVRFGMKLISVFAFAKPSGLSVKQAFALGMALTPMSALAYLIVEETYKLYPGLDPTLRAVMQCSIVFLQIVSPLLVHWGLSISGERRE